MDCFIYYDFEVFNKDWLVVLKNNKKYTVIINDTEKLKDFINDNQKKILVGFNNYNYDDMILAGILLNKNPFELSQRIIQKRERIPHKLNLLTLDVMQELQMGVGLKSSQANLGDNIVETEVDFNLDRNLTDEEIESTVKYCKNDVDSTEFLFTKRQDYFKAKFEIVKEFNLPIESIKNTRAILASKVLQCVKTNFMHDRLLIDYDSNIDFDIIPKQVKDFFKQAQYDYFCGGNYEDIEKRKIDLLIAGVPHTVAFGGLHGAIEKYNSDGLFLQIDVGSFYPSLMINNNFISRASKEPQLFKKLYDTRMKLKRQKDPKQQIYKILLNSTYGAMKSEFNSLFDPKQANNICVNGQLILIQLILELQNYCQLIQSNTDGILIKYEEKNYNKIVNIVNDFGSRFNLKFDIDKIIKVAQRDVNNYAIQYENGKVKSKGRFSKFNGGGFEQNSLTIIDKCLVNNYIYNIPVHQTIIDCYKNNDLTPFQIVCKMGNTYNGMFYEYKGELIPTQKVNRVFATRDENYGGIFKRKQDSYQKIANTSEHNIIWNKKISDFDKTKLDLNYYINLCKKNLY